MILFGVKYLLGSFLLSIVIFYFLTKKTKINSVLVWVKSILAPTTVLIGYIAYQFFFHFHDSLFIALPSVVFTAILMLMVSIAGVCIGHAIIRR